MCSSNKGLFVVENLTYLPFRYKDCNSVVLEARGEGVAGSALHAKLIPNRDQIVALVELDLIGDEPGAVLLICRILQVPVTLLLLDEAANGLLLRTGNAVLSGTPDLEVLGGVTVLILAGPLPCDDEAAAGREADFVDIEDGQAHDLTTGGGINDSHILGGSPAKEPAAWRVVAASQVSFRLGEPRKGLVDRIGIKETDGLLGSVSKLQRRSHD